MTDDQAQPPAIPTGDEDALTRADPIQTGPILRLLGLTLVGVLVGMVLADRGVLALDALQGAGGEGSAIMRVQGLNWTNRPGFENPENETRLDRFGLRNPEIPEDAPATELRVAGFGASRVYGAGGALQPWCWNYHLEDFLEAAQVRVCLLYTSPSPRDS